MKSRVGVLAIGLSLLAALPADAQVTGGVLCITKAVMPWWGGVARDATARLYDVDAHSIVLDQKAGTVTFRAKKGRFIDLDQLHESLWATRLGDGTGMELLYLDVTVMGEVGVAGKETRLKVPGSDRYFVLAEDPRAKADGKTPFARLQEALARGEKVVSVTGRVESWHGRIVMFLRERPKGPQRILVKEFQTAKWPMKDKLDSLGGALLAAVGAAPNWIAAGVLALLGLAGSTATLVAGWLAPVLIGLSLVLLGRAFYILYVHRRGTRASKVITWLSAAFVIGFWTWRLI